MAFHSIKHSIKHQYLRYHSHRKFFGLSLTTKYWHPPRNLSFGKNWKIHVTIPPPPMLNTDWHHCPWKQPVSLYFVGRCQPSHTKFRNIGKIPFPKITFFPKFSNRVASPDNLRVCGGSRATCLGCFLSYSSSVIRGRPPGPSRP